MQKGKEMFERLASQCELVHRRMAASFLHCNAREPLMKVSGGVHLA